MKVSIEELLAQLVERGGSDLHVTAGSPPKIRINGALISTEHNVLDPETSKKLVYGVMDADQVARFEKNLELDMSFGIAGLGRFRTNVFMQRGAVGCVIRTIPFKIKTPKQLGLPMEVVEHICSMPKGLALVTGATGSGKSTTLASMIDHINRTRNEHIITVEDPIEFVHRNKGCLINQREVGNDTLGFTNALRTVLRQDPDIVLIGEMRDRETIEAALTLAETGHLTFGSLHTMDAVQTMNRVIDVFPAHQQAQIRTQLSMTLSAVFSQQLLPRADGKGRVLAAEILVATPAIRSMLRDDKVHQIYSLLQTGGAKGMKTMNQSLYELYTSGLVTADEALSHTADLDELRRLIQRHQAAQATGKPPEAVES